jgi:hypothetical protein
VSTSLQGLGQIRRVKRWLVLGLAVLVLAGTGLVVARRVLKRPQTPERRAESAFAEILTDYKLEVERGVRSGESARGDSLLPDKEAEFDRRFLAFARAYPQDTHAVEALVWICTRPDDVPGIAELQEQALEMVTRQQVTHLRLGETLQRAAFTSRGAGGERFLRALAELPDRTIQGQAALYLASSFHVRSERAYYAGRPEAGPLSAEAEKELERVIATYPDVRWQDTPLDKVARQELNDMRTLGLGRRAPETAGADTSGTRFRLSDYRGKVVLLSFWGFW